MKVYESYNGCLSWYIDSFTKTQCWGKITCWQIKPSKLYLKSVIIVTFDLSLMQKSKN